jgi:Domain of Unknown Function (DUF1080)
MKKFKRSAICLFAFLFLQLTFPFFSAAGNMPLPFFATAIEGRWNITFNEDGKDKPAWLDVRHSGLNTLVGYFVSSSGSARPVSKVNFNEGKFSFSIPPQWEKGNGDLSIEGIVLGPDNISGTIFMPDGKKFAFTGVRAPTLKRSVDPVWGAPITLFNGTDLKGWKADGVNQWVAEAGVLKSSKAGANLMTEQTFSDFKLHVEFRYPKGSNSGVYLRGRYEVQVADSKGTGPAYDQLGAVYGFLVPTEMVAKEPGEWQNYDITLTGRMITVVANGKTIICNAEIPGITGGAIDSKEGDPGPIMFQGDHGPVEFRNIILTPAK